MPEWSEKYAIGVESVDREHEGLFSVISKIEDAVRANKNTAWTAEQAVLYLQRYVVRHFEDEEALMRSVGYDGYERHKGIHDGMRERVLPRLQQRLAADGYTAETVEQLLRICRKWLGRHILGHDLELAKWVPKKEPSKDASQRRKMDSHDDILSHLLHPRGRRVSRSRPWR